MKKIFLTLISVITFNYAVADENAPVNYPVDRRTGQVNTSMKHMINGDVITTNLKLCFIKGGIRDHIGEGKFEPGCSGKKIKDTATTLEYLATCNGGSETDMKWTRISENETLFESKSREASFETTSKYVGPNCDTDAIKE